MHIEELTSQMEQAVLSRAQAQPQSQPDGDAPSTAPTLTPALPPDHGKSASEILADLNKSPLFMTTLEENDDTAALQALAYEGTPLENGADFKERGNECFKEKRWADAREFYTKGVNILFLEQRKRSRGEVTTHVEVVDGADVDVEDSEDEIRQQKEVLESLYVNRAACHLELRNYRSCWTDCAAAITLNPRNVKAYYRSARALLAVDRIAEADDVCARGLALDENNGALKAVARDIIVRNERLTALQKREHERLAKEQRRALLLKAALRARGIRTRSTPQPPEMEDAKIQLVPDEDDPTSTLSFPSVLLYPLHLQSDFIKAFNETEALGQHLGYVFPLPWDQDGSYTVNGVECYMETTSGGLIKVGKKVPLLKVLGTGKVEIVDQVVRIFVVPKAKAEAWVGEFKMKKAAELAK